MGAVADSGGGQGFTVNPEGLFVGASRMHSLADDLDEGLRRVRSQAESVLGASWRGAASEAFTNEWDQFVSAAERTVENAREIAEVVRHSANIYVTSEESRAATLDAVHSGKPEW